MELRNLPVVCFILKKLYLPFTSVKNVFHLINHSLIKENQKKCFINSVMVVAT